MKYLLQGIWIWILIGCNSTSSPEEINFQPLIPQIEQTLFTSGENGYHTYRIPALITTNTGTILAFCEGRSKGSGDTGDIDILLRKSTDNGKNWSKVQTIWDDSLNVCGNPCPVIDRETGNIHLLLTWNLGSDKEKEIISGTSEDTRRVFVMESDDDGDSWSKPREITATTKDDSWGWYATGPGIGIQVRNGEHKGRMLIPCDHSYLNVGPDSVDTPFEYGSHIIYSDDHGKNWQLGGIIRPKVNECQLFEQADGKGSLVMNMRSYFGRNLRTQAKSQDGGMNWSAPTDVPGLIEPVCQASILRYKFPVDNEPGWIIFSNPASKKRENLMLKFSVDEGNSWPFSQMLYPGKTAYSSLSILPDSSIGCLFECGKNSPYEQLRFVALAEE